LIISDPVGGRIVEVKPALCRMRGCQRDELTRSLSTKLIHPGGHPLFYLRRLLLDCVAVGHRPDVSSISDGAGSSPVLHVGHINCPTPAGTLRAAGERVDVLNVSLRGEQSVTDGRGGLDRAQSSRADVLVVQVTSRDLCWRNTTTCRAGVRVFDIERQLRALEQRITLAGSLGRTDAAVAGLTAVWARQFVRGRTADSVSGERWSA
jgi:hypothetical protein